MPPLPPAPRGLKIVVSGTFQTSKWANILHAQYTSGTPLSTDLNTLAAQIGANYATNMLFTSSSLVLFTQTTVQDLASSTGAGGIDTTARTGAGVGAQMPAQAAMVVSWKIARRYRGGHPRTYLPGIISSAQADARSWGSTVAATQAAHAVTFLGYVNTLSTPSTGNIVMGSWSYFQGHTSAGVPILRPIPVFDAFFNAHVDQRIDTQRRRLGKAFG